MKLAKQAMDVGLYTNHLDPMLKFWQTEVGLPFNEMLPLGNGLRQHRHAIGESVFKLNHSRDPLAEAEPSGIRELLIAAEVDAPIARTDPDGNRITRVPAGFDGIEQMRVEITTSNVDRAMGFYTTAMGFEAITSDTVACGVTQLRFSAGLTRDDPVQKAPGYRYMTVQIFDVVAVHAQVLAAGGREGTAPVRLGDVAYISFVRDPDGNWIELSQRKSIVGSLE